MMKKNSYQSFIAYIYKVAKFLLPNKLLLVSGSRNILLISAFASSYWALMFLTQYDLNNISVSTQRLWFTEQFLNLIILILWFRIGIGNRHTFFLYIAVLWYTPFWWIVGQSAEHPYKDILFFAWCAGYFFILGLFYFLQVDVYSKITPMPGILADGLLFAIAMETMFLLAFSSWLEQHVSLNNKSTLIAIVTIFLSAQLGFEQIFFKVVSKSYRFYDCLEILVTALHLVAWGCIVGLELTRQGLNTGATEVVWHTRTVVVFAILAVMTIVWAFYTSDSTPKQTKTTYGVYPSTWFAGAALIFSLPIGYIAHKILFPNKDLPSLALAVAGTVCLLVATFRLLVLVFSNIALSKNFSLQAKTDYLTNCLNYRGIAEAISHNNHSRQKFCVVVFDINDFKSINDTYGHLMGDLFLQRFSYVLKKAINHTFNTYENNYYFGRMGGDEFIIFFVNDGLNGKTLDSLIDRLMRNFPKWWHLNGVKIYADASVAGAVEENFEDAHRNADRKMYEHKRAGKLKNSVGLKISKYTSRQLQRQKLHQAFELTPIPIDIQPVHDLRGETKILYYEALARLWNPENPAERMFPRDFLEIASQERLEYLLFEQVVKSLSTYKQMWIGKCVSINISAQLLESKEQVKLLHQTLLNKSIKPREVIFELVESSDFTSEKIEDGVNWLLTQGYQLALDDFGAGYARYEQAESGKFRYIKIDSSVTQGGIGTELGIIPALVAMANKKNILVIAEGIETIEQKQEMMNQGVHFGQGFLLGKPFAI